MPDVFAYVEHGGMDLMYLDGRRARQFARIEEPVLLNREAAAELAQAVIAVRYKFAEPSPVAVNGHVEAEALPAASLELTSDNVEAYIRANGPTSRADLAAAFSVTPKQISSRISYLQIKGRVIHMGGRWHLIGEGAAARKRITAAKVAEETTAAPSTKVYEWLKEVGPQTYDAIREHFNFENQTMWNRVWYLASTGRVVDDKDKGLVRAVRVEQKPAEPPGRKVTAAELLDYITAHPGQRRAEIIAGLGADAKSFKHAADNARHRHREAWHVDTEGRYQPGPGAKLPIGERSKLAAARRHAPPAEQPELAMEPQP